MSIVLLFDHASSSKPPGPVSARVIPVVLTLALFELIIYQYWLNENHRLGVPDPLWI